MKQTYKPVLLLYVSICCCFCNDRREKQDPVVDEEIILSVGNIQLTTYELKKNFGLFKKNNKQPLTEPEIKKWVDEYTKRSYFLADAEAKGFYQRSELVNAVETMESFILSQSGGPLEQQLLKDRTPQMKMTPALKKDFLDRYYKEIRTRSGVTIDQHVLQAIGASLQRSGPVHQLAKSEFKDLLNNDIVYFNTVEGKNIHVSLEKFIDYYNALPIQQYLVNTGSVTAYLYKISSASYIQKDAVRLGITNDPKFRLDKKNYMNGLVFRKYEEEFLKDSASRREKFIQLSQQYERKGTVDYRKFM
jgi:hypothetical protein